MSLSMSRRCTVAVLAALVSLAVVSCTSTRIIDSTVMEEFIEGELATQLGEPIADASCPQIREPELGQRFECTGMIDAKTVRFGGEVTDAEEGEVWIENADAVLPVADVESVIVDQFEAQLGERFIVDCGGERIVVHAPGDSFRCEIADTAGNVAEVRVDVLDAEGNIEFEIETG